MSKVRSSFYKSVYTEVYEEKDRNMSISNAGGRKKDNLIAVYAAINDVINGTGESFYIQGYDFMICFVDF